MLHRFFDTIRGIHTTSTFDTYMNNLQRSGRTGMPRVDEARKDFRSFVKRDGWPLV
ncbi:MAG: hypothetical protein IH862_08860 [Chloroflexi bacterium]|nr:hypothetical protein [Chloroflexota bacterium]